MPLLSPSRFALAALIFLGALSSSRALQLGETQAQIAARHGAPAVEDHGRQLAMYFWPGWSARLEFHEGVVAKLTYKKNDYLGPADITSLLQANGGIKRWRETSPEGAKIRQWARDDGAVASCDSTHAIGMVFEGGQAAIAALRQLAAPEPKVAAPPIARVKPAATPDFFPDPQAVQSKPDPKLSEISGPSAPPKADPAKAIEMAKVIEPAKPVEPAPSSPVPPVAKVAAPSQPPSLPSKPVETKTAESPNPPTAKTAEPPALAAEPVKRNPEPASARIEPPSPIEPPAAPGVAEPEILASGAPEEFGIGRALALGCMIFGITGALVLLYKSIPRRQAREASSPRRAASDSSGDGSLQSLRWDQFELLVAEIHRRAGYVVELSAGLGIDAEVDLTLRRDSETFLVQCKHWKVLRATERELREFYGAMASSGAPRGVFVTMGVFARDAREFAEGKGIDLIDRRTLEERMAAVARPGENLCFIPGWIEEFVANSRIFDPECPVCRETMTLRQNRTEGSAYWGCRNFPRCSGKREPRGDILELAEARRARPVSPAA